MTKEENGFNELVKGIQNYIDIKMQKVPYVKTDNAVVVSAGTSFGNKIRVRDVIYDNVKSVGNIVYPEASVVYVIAPNGQYNNMFILGQLSDTPANIVGGTIDIGNGNFTVDSNGTVTATNGSFTGNITSSNANITGGSVRLTSSRYSESLVEIHSEVGKDTVEASISAGDITFKKNNNMYANIGGYSGGNITLYPPEYSGVLTIDGAGLTVTGWDSGQSVSLGDAGNVVASNNITCKTLTQTSSREVKENIIPIESGNGVLDLNPVSFDYINGSKNQRGFIAEEVEEIYPELVDNSSKVKSLNYIGLIPYLVKQIQTMQKEIDELKSNKPRKEE